ncbi:HPr kinase/phosphatase C-terminal domain-containing protein [Methylocystis sp. WRRC1]|uniref:HPr kinase/phosphorylase n=1 Tax=Methylocystis sp. WRRC1 TaxID=1732014 RepID=UPI001D15A5D7|nr:HPr kinase/phosphatase C-terminal domain-containing protein [Methylocystis sp. WRRC1]MCC3245982.1 HPr kinase/phosphatase C-terminal domain-containing protein [Methylocystis sp. WRRC1]
MSGSPASVHIHANALVIGERGLLLRGPSGAGKSALTLALIAQAQARGDFARLVGDDRVAIEALGGRLIARPHPAIRGLIEARGEGLLEIPHEPACVIHAVVDLCEAERPPERYPEEDEKCAKLLGLTLPRRRLAGGGDAAVAQIFNFIQSVTIK